MKTHLPKMFPGAEIKEWKVKRKKLTGRQQEAFEAIRTHFPKGAGVYECLASKVAKSIGMRSGDFVERILKDTLFQDKLAELNLALVKDTRWRIVTDF